MPWAEAIKEFGEEALKQGHSHQRVSNWRRDGVPGNVLIPLYRRKLNQELSAANVESNQLAAVATRLASLVNLPPSVLAALNKLQQVYDETKGEGPRWRRVEVMLQAAVQMAGEEN